LSGELVANFENKTLQSRQLTDISGKKSTYIFLNIFKFCLFMHFVHYSYFLLQMQRHRRMIKTLIDEWRGHESYFKSTTITNKKSRK